MQQVGRWQSMPEHYAQAHLASRGTVAKLRDGK